MERLFFVVVPIFFIGISLNPCFGQQPATPLEDYLNNAQTIVVARCLSSGSLDILLRSNVELEVLQVVKGDPKMKTLRVLLSGGLTKGESYLIRLPDPAKSREKAGFGTEGANVIPVSGDEDMELLKTLSPRIVVLRTINRRIDELRDTIRQSTYELDALAAVKASD